jgi:hypothetical protein
MLNLSHDWMQSYLPFILQKVNRVHFGLLQPQDIQQLEADGVKIPTSRKLVAVPFIAKDVPSRASEFAHPDVLIGLTILAFRYEGLRRNDFFIVLKHLHETMDEESEQSQVFGQGYRTADRVPAALAGCGLRRRALGGNGHMHAGHVARLDHRPRRRPCVQRR